MTHSYDFIIKAYRVPAFKSEIIQHIEAADDSEMIYDFAILKFDSKNRIIREYPNEGVFLSNKVIPMELSYDGFYEIMNSKEPWLICEKVCKYLLKVR